MSGIAGLVHLAGGPVSPEILAAMVAAIAERGPDDQAVRSVGPAGLGHAQLRTTDEAARERQPHSLDGQVWITADARVDGRGELRRLLEAAGRTPMSDATDVDLLLHAYDAWGDACVEHLIGDFAFAIWDGPRRRLFCARDHLGLRPFFYTRAGDLLALASNLAAVKAVPDVSTELDDLAIADFLLFGFPQEFDTTPYRFIRRLPPAHALIVENGAVTVRRYWSPPIEEPLRLARREEYVERFLEVFDEAVADRLRTERISIHMSGGLDSTSVAATAQVVTQHSGHPLDLRAFVIVYDRLIPDVERSWATAAARLMGIPLEVLVVDDYEEFAAWVNGDHRPQEPGENTLRELDADLAEMTARHSRVVLTGQGGDVVFYPESGYLLGEIRRLRPHRALGEVGGYWRRHRRLPPLYVRSTLRRRLGLRQGERAEPLRWINPALVQALSLDARWQEYRDVRPGPHPVRREGFGILFSRHWSHIMDDFSVVEPGQPVLEYRHPFLDQRVVRLLLRVPPVPWCVNKELLREAMRGRLPEAIRRRPKMPLAGEPVHPATPAAGGDWMHQLMDTPELRPFLALEYGQPPPGTGAQRDFPPTHAGASRALGVALWFHYHSGLRGNGDGNGRRTDTVWNGRTIEE